MVKITSCPRINEDSQRFRARDWTVLEAAPCGSRKPVRSVVIGQTALDDAVTRVRSGYHPVRSRSRGEGAIP